MTRPYDLIQTTCYQCDKVIYREKPGQGLCVTCKHDNAEAEKYDRWIELMKYQEGADERGV